MKTQPNNKLLCALVKTLGQPLAWVLRKQLCIVSWLMSKGWSRELSKLMLKVLNIFIFAIILFLIFPVWQVLIALFIIFIGVTVIEIEPPESTEEWRDGIDGWGLYDNQFGTRIDGGSSNNENDPNR